MSTHPMPACEALAADPARYMFRRLLQQLRAARNYDEQRAESLVLLGYLSCALEVDLIDCETHRLVGAEIKAFVWGPAQ
ncbi:hypothetical protein QK899_08705 [Pseudomonas sp. AR5]|nr:hypothetical protein QK899_08705 [Pseudomonas sp. AR5]